MDLEREFERRIKKLRGEITELESQLGVAKTTLATLQETAKWVLANAGKEPILRAGTDLAKARDLIKERGKPLHVEEILKGIGKEVNKGNKISLSGSLGGYARQGKIFNKPAPNTFGLIELEKPGESTFEMVIDDLIQQHAG